MSTKKKAISPKKDRAARTVDRVAATRSGAKKPNKGPTKKTVLKEALEHSTKSSTKKSRSKKRAHKTKAQRQDPLLGLLEVEAVEDC